jgi:hypothetical protein
MNRIPSLAVALASLAALSVAACAGASSTYHSSGGGAASVVHPLTAPSPTPTPIPLKAGGSVGTMVYPDGNTNNGGQGNPKDGIPCKAEQTADPMVLTQLTLIVNGEQIMVPKGTGMHGESLKANFIYHAKCFYYIHTHDHTGLIQTQEPAGSPQYTVGNWFDVWGENISTTQIGGFQGAVSVYIDGVLQPGQDPSTVPLTQGEQITLLIGTPLSWIPQYVIPTKYPNY